MEPEAKILHKLLGLENFISIRLQDLQVRLNREDAESISVSISDTRTELSTLLQINGHGLIIEARERPFGSKMDFPVNLVKAYKLINEMLKDLNINRYKVKSA